MSELIDKALADCDDTDVVIMGHDVLDETGRVFKELFGGAKAIIIADENTWAVAGEQTKASLGRDRRADDLPGTSHRLRLLREHREDP